MPNYLFKHPKTKRVIEIFQHMNEHHVYVDEFGVEWERIFTVPNASMDTTIDPYSKKDFLKSTNKKGTIGDLMDRSAEIAAKRKEKDGVDHVQEKYYEDWSRKRGGRTHPDKQKEVASKKVKETLDKISKQY